MSSRVHDIVVTCPADVRRAGDQVVLSWVKRRLKCGNAGCPRKTFTERVPAVPPRCRVTRRLLEQCRAEVADRGITPAEAARHAGVSWPSVARRVRAPGPTSCWTRRWPRSRTWASTSTGAAGPGGGRIRDSGQYVQLADRWHVLLRPVRRAGDARAGRGPHRRRRRVLAAPGPAGLARHASRSSPSTCARSSCPPSAAPSRARRWPWTCSTSSSSRSRPSATSAAAPPGRSTAAAGRTATPSTGSRAC